jgi:two-component system response regulator DegU
VDKITILLIDEKVYFRDRVRKTLSQQPDFKVLDCDLSEDPMATVHANYTDVVLLGSDITTTSSVELSREIVLNYPNTKVIVMSPNPNDDELFEFIKTAAVAYLDKKTVADELYGIIRRGCRGEYPINESVLTRPKVAQHVLKQFEEIDSMGRGMERIAAPLTDLEKLILTFATNCIYKKQIARTLRVNERTVENHVSAILRKLITYDRAQAMALSMQDASISA